MMTIFIKIHCGKNFIKKQKKIYSEMAREKQNILKQKLKYEVNSIVRSKLILQIKKLNKNVINNLELKI